MGEIVRLHNKGFNLRNYQLQHPGVVDFDIIEVFLDNSFTGKTDAAIILNAPLDHIGLLHVDTTVGDGVHLGKAVQNAVIEFAAVETHDLAATPQHWDGIQVQGGNNVQWLAGYSRQRNSKEDVEGRALIYSEGGKLTEPDSVDVVFHNFTFVAHRELISTKSQVVTIALSERCGITGCVVAEGHGGGDPVLVKPQAIDPVLHYTIKKRGAAVRVPAIPAKYAI